MMSMYRPYCNSWAALAVVMIVVAVATPLAEADGQVVVFSKTADDNSSVSYTISGTGVVSHLIVDLVEGTYTVSQDGSELGLYSCYGAEHTAPDGYPGDNALQFTSTGGGTFSVMWSATLSGETPPAPPVITSNGGADYTTSEPALLLEGTCADVTDTIQVNGSTYGVSYVAGETVWSYTDTLNTGVNLFQVTAQDSTGLTSPADTIRVTLDSNEPPPAPSIDTDGGSGPGADFTTNDPQLTLTGTCDSSTASILVNGSTAGVSYTPGSTSWAYTASEIERIPVSAIAFQGEGTEQADVLTSVSTLDDIWSPADIVPVGTVIYDGYATGPGDTYFDAISLEFPSDGIDLSDLTLRVYLQKGAYLTSWEHYEILPGTLNPYDEDTHNFVYTDNDSRDHLPFGQLPSDTVVGWVEFPFDATSDPLFTEPNGNIGITLRLWNWRVDAVTLAQGASGAPMLDEGDNVFSVTAIDDLGNESAAGTITVTLDTVAPAAPVITTGSGIDFTTSNAALTVEGTCTADSAVIRVNGLSDGVDYVAGQTGWSCTVSLAEGANTFIVTAEDYAGNVSPADTITVTLNSASVPAPVITTNGGNGPGQDYLTNQPAIVLEGTCESITASIRVNGTDTGVTYTAGATSWTFSGVLTEGLNTFAVTAHDAMDNASAADTIVVQLDTSPPPSIRPQVGPQ